ncbi:MAG TPA: TonB-dependent receptor [Terriglobales bacterium]|nr:TonB-dependent receptor [Terriglobales bacterium]
MPTPFPRLRTLSAMFFSIFLPLATPLWAQKDAGAIVGLVRDPSGAVVTGAKVTVTDVDRGIHSILSTNDEGQYVASPLRIGRYSVTVEKQGFRKAVAGPVQVNIQDRVSVDLKLQPGMATEVVTVTGQRPQLETGTSELGQVVDSRTINALPLNGRNYAQLALLGVGVAAAEPGSRVETTYGFSANGARSLQNNFLLDGIDNNANLGDVLNGAAYVVQPAVDAIAEFKVETNSYSAEFGRGNGAIMNAVIKSGTNQIHGDVWEFLRNEKVDASNYFDIFGKQPYKQNQFGFTLGGPIIKNKLFFFGDYEGLRIRQALPQLSTVPTPAEVGGDFSAFLPAVLDSTTATGFLDCRGNRTYPGEIFDPTQAETSSPYNGGACSLPIGTTGPNYTGTPTNKFTNPGGTSTAIDPLGQELANLFPAPNATINTLQAAGNFLSDPKRSETENKFDIRGDYTISEKDNFFARYSYGNDSNFLPSPFNNVLDGGSFQDGYSQNVAQGLAASEIHSFRNNLINEFRFGFNHLNSHRYNLYSNVNVSQQIPGGIPFPGVPFEAGQNIGGLPSISFGDGTTNIGASQFLPAVEDQNSYVFTDNLSWTHGHHAAKFGAELRFEQFTILEPADPRGYMDFGQNFLINDNPAAPGTGGEAFASFMQGISDGGSITSVTPNVDYRRQIYAVYALDDFKVTPRLTLNLGLRYELFTTIKEANDHQGNFDFTSLSLIVPKGQNAQLTPTLGTELAIQNNGSRGLIRPDRNNFAPRIGLAYQLSDRLVLRSGYGIFYGGQENGPFSNPSPGFNPPFLSSEAYNAPCQAPSASSAQDCSISAANNNGLALNQLQAGFSNNTLTGKSPLSDPNAPELYSLDPHLVTPYTQQWHLGIEYQLPADTVLAVSYAGSRGLKLFAFYNGNQPVPVLGTDSLPTAPRRPANDQAPGASGPCTLADGGINCNSALDVAIPTFRSNAQSNYNSLQVRLEKRYSHGLQYEAAYTWAHALDNASSADLGSVSNGDFRDQRYPNAEYGNADFDVRHRFVFSYVYDLPFGRGRLFAKNVSGFVNQILGNWQMAGVFSAATGNYYTATDITNVSGSDSGGNVGVYSSRPARVGNPNAKPCIPGTLFNTCAFADDGTIPGIIPLGTFGNAGRNIIEGPGYKTWDTSLVKQFPIREQKHLEFRAEFFNILNHVNYLFGQFGAISAEPTPLELGQSGFGYPLAARAPRQIQFALKFYF